MRLFRNSALVIGMPLLALLVLSLLTLIFRYLYVEVRGPLVDETHLAAKETYLSSIKAGSAEKFNIVLIFFDDLGWGDLSSYGNEFIKTPNIDGLSDEGLKMTNFYSASPVCTPSRAALLTGRFPPRTRTDKHVFFNDDHVVGVGRRIMGYANALPKEEITLPEVLRQVGYQTHMVGKWHLGSREGYFPTDFGFDNWFGVLYSNDMFPLNLYDNNNVIIEDQRDGGFLSAERDEQQPLAGSGIDQTGLTQRYTEQAVSFLEEQGDEPFFLYLAHSLPHVPHYASKEFAGTSKGGTYGDVVEDLDRSTGAIMQALKRLDLEENTLVIVTSDNGADYNGSPGSLRGRKAEILEGGQRVPMIVRWPGRIPAGSVTDAMAMNTDIMPTLLELLGISPPQDRIIDGVDITSTLVAGTPEHELLYYFPTTKTLPGAIRDADFKLTLATGDGGRNREHLSRTSGTEAHEVSNLYPETFDRLKAQLLEMRDEIEANPRGWATD
ncbi:MAG: arylsulfatase A-like enzyme [Candidatus Azotimanducaceae bacterium]|jgi:arylsulfatase A-like enzyme